MMRLLFRLLLFPVTLALSIAIGVYWFVCDCSGAVLSVVATLLFMLAVLTLILVKDSGWALTTAAIACVLSPYGISWLASWFLYQLDEPELDNQINLIKHEGYGGKQIFPAALRCL